MTYQFKIQINDIDSPVVWRRLFVPVTFTFWKLHELIQTSFGWKDAHLFEFSLTAYGSGPKIGIPYPDAEEFILDAREINLSEIFYQTGQQYIYLYDFGDSWEHLITLENIHDYKMVKAAFNDGEGACPPEDCGGVSGYGELKSLMSNPSHPEFLEMKEWLGLAKSKQFNAYTFNAEKISVQVAKV